MARGARRRQQRREGARAQRRGGIAAHAAAAEARPWQRQVARRALSFSLSLSLSLLVERTNQGFKSHIKEIPHAVRTGVLTGAPQGSLCPYGQTSTTKHPHSEGWVRVWQGYSAKACGARWLSNKVIWPQ